MGNNCDQFQPYPEPEFEGGAKDCPPEALHELEFYPEPGGPRQREMNKCDSDMELGNYTFDGCVHLTLDMNKLCIALNVHAYLFGSLFLILVIIASVALFTTIRNQQRGSKAFIVTINVLVIIFGLMRALYLFIDAYALKGRIEGVGALLFADLGIPCLTSAFALVQWMFFELLQLKRVTRALQKSRVLVGIVVSHFVFIAAIDFLLFYVGKEACFLMIVCQAVNVLWGLILTLGFLYTTQKLLKRDKEHRSTLKRSQYGFSGQSSTVKTLTQKKDQNNSIKTGQTDSLKTISGRYSPRMPRKDAGKQNGIDSSLVDVAVSETNSETLDMLDKLGTDIDEDPIFTRPLRRLRRTLKSSFSRSAITRKSYLTKVKNAGIATTFVGLALSIVSLYGLIAVYNPYTSGALPGGDWGWYTFQTLQRILELCFGLIMVYLSMSKSRR